MFTTKCFLKLSILAAALSTSVATFSGDLASIAKHPDSSDWKPLFNGTLSNAVYPKGVWTVSDGVLTASEDQAIWSQKDYQNFVLDLEFKNAEETNSGVIVYCSDMGNWIPNSVEIQIADDHAKKWGVDAPANWRCGAAFGHLAATESAVNKPGEWNRYTITCVDGVIFVVLNDTLVNVFHMARWTSAKTNPDGSEIPSWLSKPKAELATHGRIGFQGKHAGAPIYFRNIRIKELE